MRNKTRIFLIFMSALALFSACKDTLDISSDRDGRHETVELRFNIGCGSVGSPSATATRSSGDKALPVSKVRINDSTIAEISVESTDLFSLSGSRGTRGTLENPPGGETGPFSSSLDTVPAPGIEINEKCGTYYIVAYKSGKWHGVVKGRIENGKFKITKKLGFDSNNPSPNPHVSPGEYDFACINTAVEVPNDSCKDFWINQPEAGVALIGMKRVKIDSKSGQHDVNMILHGFGSRVAVELLDYRYKSHFTGKIDVQGEIYAEKPLAIRLDSRLAFPGIYNNGLCYYVEAALGGHPKSLSVMYDENPQPLKVNGFNQIYNFHLYLLDNPLEDSSSPDDYNNKLIHGHYNNRYHDFVHERSSAFVNDPFPVELDAGSSFFKMFGNLWCVNGNYWYALGDGWENDGGWTLYPSAKRASLLYDFYLYSAPNDWKLAIEKSFPELSQDEKEYIITQIIVRNASEAAKALVSSTGWREFYNDDLLIKKILKPYGKIDLDNVHSFWGAVDQVRACLMSFINKSDSNHIYNSIKYFYYCDFIANHESNYEKDDYAMSYSIDRGAHAGCTPAIYQSVPFKYFFPGNDLNDLKFRFTQGKGLAGKTVSLMKATGEAAKEIEPGKFYHFIIKLKSASEKYPGLLDPVE